MQENISTDALSDHDQGVLCQDGPQRILEVLRRNGFALQKQTTDNDRALWTLVQSGSGGGGGGGAPHQPVHPPAPQPTPNGGGDADAGGEDQGENNEEGGEEEEEEEAEGEE